MILFLINLFQKIYKILILDNFRECIPYVCQFINNSLIEKLNEDINNMKIQNKGIFYQDYDEMKKKISINAIKNHVD